MDKKLLLLGILRAEDMHGYQLNEFIDTSLSFCVDLKKPTAYYLLNKMNETGWVTYETRQQGNRPARRIYSLTAEGEAAFQQLLRQNLARHHPVQFSGDIGLAFSDQLSREEALVLLRERRSAMGAALQAAQDIPEHLGAFQLMVEHHRRHLETELSWLDEVIARLEGDPS